MFVHLFKFVCYCMPWAPLMWDDQQTLFMVIHSKSVSLGCFYWITLWAKWPKRILSAATETVAKLFCYSVSRDLSSGQLLGTSFVFIRRAMCCCLDAIVFFFFFSILRISIRQRCDVAYPERHNFFLVDYRAYASYKIMIVTNSSKLVAMMSTLLQKRHFKHGSKRHTEF